MKSLANKLQYLFLVSMLICSSISDSFAQTSEELSVYQDYIEQYYKNKTAEEIWRDYLALRLKQDGTSVYLIETAVMFKEPFKSWAENEILKNELNNLQLTGFLSYDFSEKAKNLAFKRYLETQLSDFSTAISVPYLERTIDLLILLSLDSDATLNYRQHLISRVFNDPNMVYISNEKLVSLLPHCSFEQKIKIAERVFYNNPQRHELYMISIYQIDGYSDMAKALIWDQRTLLDDPNYVLDSARRGFLTDKIFNWPN